MTLDHHSIKNIQYTLPQGDFFLNRIAFGKPGQERISWVLQKPEGKYIPQTENLNTAMGHLSRLQAEDYIDEKSLEQYNLQHPHYALHITMKDNTTHTIKASIQNDTYYVVLDDQMPIVTLQATDFTKIFPKFDEIFKVESVEEKPDNMPEMPEQLENLEEAPKALEAPKAPKAPKAPEKLENVPVMPEALENVEEAPKSTIEATEATEEDTLNVLESITDDSEKTTPIE